MVPKLLRLPALQLCAPVGKQTRGAVCFTTAKELTEKLVRRIVMAWQRFCDEASKTKITVLKCVYACMTKGVSFSAAQLGNMPDSQPSEQAASGLLQLPSQSKTASSQVFL